MHEARPKADLVVLLGLVIVLISLLWSLVGPSLFARLRRRDEQHPSECWADIVADWAGEDDPILRRAARGDEPVDPPDRDW